MNTCPNCGERVNEGDTACRSCGETLHRWKMKAQAPDNASEAVHLAAERERLKAETAGDTLGVTLTKVFLVLSSVLAAITLVALLVLWLSCISGGLTTKLYFNGAELVAQEIEGVEELLISLVGVNFALLLAAIYVTVKYFERSSEKQKISTPFKVFALIFVSPVAGLLMLLDTGERASGAVRENR